VGSTSSVVTNPHGESATPAARARGKPLRPFSCEYFAIVTLPMLVITKLPFQSVFLPTCPHDTAPSLVCHRFVFTTVISRRNTFHYSRPNGGQCHRHLLFGLSRSGEWVRVVVCLTAVVAAPHFPATPHNV
jgi:hypothetical protein